MFSYCLMQLALLYLKWLNWILKLFLGYSLFSGQVKEKDNSLKSFDSCAHRVKILARAKVPESGPANIGCILCLHASYEDPVQAILENDDVILIGIDRHGATFGLFPGLGPMDLFNSKHGPFLYNVQFHLCTELIIVPLKFIQQLAQAARKTEPQIVLFSNLGRCGSTLLTQMFEAIPGTVTLSEPTFMAAFLDDSWITENNQSKTDLLAAGLKLQCKTLNKPEVKVVMIKTASFLVALAGNVKIACPEVRHIFMFRNFAKYHMSMLSLINSIPKILRLLPMYNKEILNLLFALIPQNDTVLLEKFNNWKSKVGSDSTMFVAIYGGLHFRRYQYERDQNGVDFGLIKYEDLVIDPIETFQHIARHCGFKDFPIEKCLKAMQKDSQKGSIYSRERLKQYKHDAVSVNEIIFALEQLGLTNLPEISL